MLRAGKDRQWPSSFAAAVPQFRIFSVEKAREFYLGFLGFKVDWELRRS